MLRAAREGEGNGHLDEEHIPSEESWLMVHVQGLQMCEVNDLQSSLPSCGLVFTFLMVLFEASVFSLSCLPIGLCFPLSLVRLVFLHILSVYF